MPRVKINTLRSFAREEQATARLYKHLGFKRLGRQEAKHAKFFRFQIKKLRRRA